MKLLKNRFSLQNKADSNINKNQVHAESCIVVAHCFAIFLCSLDDNLTNYHLCSASALLILEEERKDLHSSSMENKWCFTIYFTSLVINNTVVPFTTKKRQNKILFFSGPRWRYPEMLAWVLTVVQFVKFAVWGFENSASCFEFAFSVSASFTSC